MNRLSAWRKLDWMQVDKAEYPYQAAYAESLFPIDTDTEGLIIQVRRYKTKMTTHVAYADFDDDSYSGFFEIFISNKLSPVKFFPEWERRVLEILWEFKLYAACRRINESAKFRKTRDEQRI